MGKHSARNPWRSRLAAGTVLTLGAATTVAIVMAPADATTSGTLPGGTSISVDVASPTSGTHFAPGSSVTVSGSASVGAASNTPNTTLVTGLDSSGSTSTNAGTTACGNQNGDSTSNDVLDCEIAAAVNLNGAAVSAGTILDVGAVPFADPGVTADVGPAAGNQLVTGPNTDAGGTAGARDIEEVFKSVTRGQVAKFTVKSTGTATNFTSAILQANTILSASAGTNKVFVLMSDGLANGGGSTLAAIQAAPANKTIYTFAVGSGSACGSATDPNHQSLAYIAANAHGTCTAVPNPGNLPSILPALVSSHLTSLTLSVDGGAATTISGTTPALPITGPGSVTYSTATGSLAPGTHNLCVTANGTDPGAGSVQECKSVIVDKYQVTVTAQHKTKVYGTANPSLTFTTTGFQGGDGFTTQPSCTTTATTTSNVGNYPITCSGGAVADPTKYNINYVDDTLTITTAASVVTAPTLTKTFGDPDPAVTPSISNGAPGPSNLSCTIASPHVNVGSYAITCTGFTTEGNYTYTYQSGSLTINRAASVVQAPTLSKTFGDPDPVVTPSISNGAPGPSNLSCSIASPHVNVGSYAITCTGFTTEGNFTYTYQPGSLTVTPLASVVTCPIVHKTFGTADPSFAPTASNGAPVPGAASCTPPASHSNVGTYTLTASGPAAQGNYTYTYVDGSLIVDPATSVVTCPTVHKTFGTADPSFAPNASNGAPVPATASCTPPASHSNVGTYTLTATGPAAAGNYTYTYVDGSLIVDPAASVVTCPTVHKTFGDADPSFAPTASNGAPVPAGAACTPPASHSNVGTYTLTATGPAAAGNYTYTYVNGSLIVDAAGSVVTCPTVHKTFGDPDPSFAPTASNGAPVPATAACTPPASHSNVGTYTLTATGPAAEGNYNYTYANGSLTVDPAASVVTCPTVHKTFGTADPSFAPSASNGAPVPGAASCTPPASHSNVGTYTLTASGPTAQGNYTYTYVDGSLIVDPATSVVTCPTVHKTYGDLDPSFAPSATNGAPVPAGAACTPPANHSNVGTYTLTATGPAAAGNYTYTYVDGSLTVDPAASVVTGPTVHKTFGDPDPSFAPTASNGAPVPATASCTPPASHSNVGTYTLTCTGPSAEGNYTYTYVDGSLIVDPAASVVTGPTVHKTYGDPDPSFAPTASNGAPVPATASCTPPASHSNVGTYTLTCTGPAAEGNYTYTYVNGSLTVDPAQVTVTAQDVVKHYGQPDPPFTPQVSGLVNGDQLPASVTCSATNPHTNVGTYDITCTGPAASGNYTFTYYGPATLTVLKADPTVSTTPSGTTKLGGFASDSATVGNTLIASGTVTFQLFGPGDSTCTTPLATVTKPVAGNAANSGNVQIVWIAGTYRWKATYNGDTNNNTGFSGCDDELFTVTGQRLTGRAFGLSVASNLGSIPLINIAPLPDTGPVSTLNSTAVEPPCLANIALLVGVQADCAVVATRASYPATSDAVASLATAQIPISTLPLISVGAVQAESRTTCAGSAGATTIAFLRIGGITVISKPTVILKPNTTLNVGVVKVVLNEQKAFSTPDKGLTVNAIHITVNALGVAKANIIISSAESDISGCP